METYQPCCPVRHSLGRIIAALFPMLLCLAVLPSCTAELDAPDAPGRGRIIEFSAAFDATKTVLTEGNGVEWIEGDRVSIFDGAANVQAFAAQSGASTTLSATVSTDGPWYALYPYDAAASISAGVITTTLDDSQAAVEGTFAPDVNISVAYSQNQSLLFRNVLGFVKLTVSNNLIRKIVLSGNDGEVLAGKIRIGQSGGVPSAEVAEGRTSVTLAPAEGYFTPGGTYYIAVLPVNFGKGFTLDFVDAFGDSHVFSTEKSVQVARSHILNVGSPDSDCAIDGPIEFADPEVKYDIVKAFGGGIVPGEIYKSEAAAVTFAQFDAYSSTVTNNRAGASPLWSEPSEVDSFDEFRYFIGLARSATDYRTPIIFPGCHSLESVTLPYNLTTIANYTFFECDNLQTIILPDGLKYIYGRAFSGCSSLKGTQTVEGASGEYLVFPKTLIQLSTGAFHKCESLGKIENTGCVLSTIGTDAFYGCTNMSFRTRNFPNLISPGRGAFAKTKITNITLPASGLSSIPDSLFFQCTSLVSVKLGDDVTSLGKHVCNGCTKLETFSCESTTDKKLVLPSSLTSIGDYCFSNCPKLGAGEHGEGVVVIKEGLISLGQRCFRYCKAFRSVDLPSTLKTMKNGVFSASSSNPVTLTTLICRAALPPTVSTVLAENEYTTISSIYVPGSSLDAYRAAAGWKDWMSVISAISPEMSPADLTVRGCPVDIRTWGLTDTRGQYIFPLHGSSYRFTDVTDITCDGLAGQIYAVSHYQTQGIGAVKASAMTSLKIATALDLSGSSEWKATGESFRLAGYTYRFYRRVYTEAEAAAGTWVDVPHHSAVSSFVMNSGGAMSIEAPEPPVTIIDRAEVLRSNTVNNPNIIRLQDGTLLASYSRSGNVWCRIFKSVDGGLSWTRLSEITDTMAYGEMYWHDGTLYYMGCNDVGGGINICRSNDGGASWSRTVELFPANPVADTAPGYHGASNHFTEHDGRVWRAYGERFGSTTWGVLLVSAPLDSDLMDPRSWTMSNIVYYDPSYVTAESSTRWEEPTVFEDKDGGLKIMIRVDGTSTGEYACILDVNSPTEIVYSRTVAMPGGTKKFDVKWDETSGRYWSLVSPGFLQVKERYGLSAGQIRNALTLVSSADLVDWRIERICVYSDNPYNNSYHYMDWVFDGDDLVTTFRCSFDESRGMAYSYHDSNGFGFFRVRNFRNPSAVPTVFYDSNVTPGEPVLPEY